MGLEKAEEQRSNCQHLLDNKKGNSRKKHLLLLHWLHKKLSLCGWQHNQLLTQPRRGLRHDLLLTSWTYALSECECVCICVCAHLTPREGLTSLRCCQSIQGERRLKPETPGNTDIVPGYDRLPLFASIAPVGSGTIQEAKQEKSRLTSLREDCCCSVTQSCPTVCDPMDCSTTGLLIPHHLLEFAQAHVHLR